MNVLMDYPLKMGVQSTKEPFRLLWKPDRRGL